MSKRLFALLLACILLWVPVSAAAAPFKIGFTITRPDEGVICSELTYNDDVIWKVQVLSDGTKPALAGNNEHMTIVVPDISYGLFTIKIN